AQLLTTPLPLQVGAGEASVGPALPTGIPALDAAAPGGVPRGRLTEVVARRGGGRTTLLRQLVEQTVAAGGWVAVVDASRTLAPRDWAHAGESGRLWIVRPEAATRAAWCVDVLLRSGAFALVVLDAAPPLTRAVAVRLTRLARETGAAFVVAGESGAGAVPTQLGGALRLRVSAIPRSVSPRRWQQRERGRSPTERTSTETANSSALRLHSPRSSALPALVRAPAVHRDPEGMTDRTSEREPEPAAVIAILVEKGGIHRTVEVGCAIELSRRLCAHPEVPDRRGVARRAAGGGAPRGGGAAGVAASSRRPAADGRRPDAHHVSPFQSSLHRGRKRVATPDYPRARAGALG
ncbi:MAG TPA: hypothetical protein VEA99_00455, partial [Gemmatimonadaceae bacterium]|nr:hypothetical protein [Gemmatimonadaceae bacterium]